MATTQSQQIDGLFSVSVNGAFVGNIWADSSHDALDAFGWTVIGQLDTAGTSFKVRRTPGDFDAMFTDSGEVVALVGPVSACRRA